MTPEFSRPVRLDALGAAPHTVAIAAQPAERAALALRFGLVAIDRLEAQACLSRDGEVVAADGRITAAVTQSCVASGEPVEASVDGAFRIQFRPPPSGAGEEEVELGQGELDVIFYEGGAVDLGEAAAQTLWLSLDPYPRAPNAEQLLREAGVKSAEEAGPFAALAGLRDSLGK